MKITLLLILLQGDTIYINTNQGMYTTYYHTHVPEFYHEGKMVTDSTQIIQLTQFLKEGE